ncbi:MAG: DUF4268 domain-containing protein [Gemmatimonadetes bacterium]|nr:DUF4268 domain-containing protein [Gemmatimonadota bacterium]MYG86084.1 DUF4268 domain-containing protein [Gemmatimonadota bacterium]MYJ90955.1 DUF4268 domain-containing protein [Gemmatimonadota bacterium]
MFKVDLTANHLVQLEERRFSDLKLNERDHLQEWLVHTPEALGEDLLVIQKEFDGFEDTRERLDLLALDKEGRVVVIENKLDDSGRDVVWQALKYVAYCSSLKKAEIVDIYQKYLNRWVDGESAIPNLCEFLGVEDLDDTVLNAGNEQRLILVAANFRKEVTATVLWLIGHGVEAQCFRVVPYSFGEELLIDLQQIIPTPEAADYMIGMANKESEEKASQRTLTQTQQLRHAFWEKTLEALRARGVSRYENISPSRDHWLASSTGVAGCGYNMIFGKNLARVDLYMTRSQADENKRIFDQLIQEKQDIESRFGKELNWQRLNDKKACRISFPHSFDGFDEENWPEMIEWLCEHIVKLEEAFSDPLDRVNRDMKSWSDITTAEETVPS